MKKLLSIILSVACLVSGLAVSAFADTDISTSQLDAAEGYFSDWEQTGTVRSLDRDDFMEGEGCYSFSGSDMTVAVNFNGISCPGGVKNEKYFEFWFYVDNAALLSEDCKVIIYKDDIKKYKTVKSPFLGAHDGWNKLVMNLNLVIASVDEVNKIEFIFKASDTVRVKLDDLSFAHTKTLSDRAALDEVLARAKSFDTSDLTEKQQADFSKFIGRSENDVQTQRDADALASTLEKYMSITAEKGKFDDIITTHGRTFYENDELHMTYSASGFTVRFYGTRLTADLYTITGRPGEYGSPTNRSYVNIYIDNDRNMYDFYCDFDPTDGEATFDMQDALADYDSRCPHQLIDSRKEYVLAEGLEEGIHTVTVLRRNEVCLNKEIVMTDLHTDGSFLTPPKKSTRRIEVIGDSNITAFGNMSIRQAYKPETQDATVSYASYIADAFGAEYTITARCGAYTEPVPQPSVGTPEFFTNTYLFTDYWNTALVDGAGKPIQDENGYVEFDPYNPENTPYPDSSKLYDFAAADNDIVIVNMGDNDVWDKPKTEETRTHFAEVMKHFLQQVRLANPDALIIYAFSLNTGSFRDCSAAAAEAYAACGDENFVYVDLRFYDQQGGSGHPSMQVHQKAAQQVVNVIKEKLGWEGVLREVYTDPTKEDSKLITLSDDYALVGSTVTFTADGLAENVKVTSHGQEIDFTEKDGVYSFTMPEGSVMVSADVKEQEKIMYGDVDNNGEITVNDALLALQSAVGKIQLSDGQIKAGDVDGTEGLSVSDARLILQKAVGKIEEFTLQQ